MRLTARLLLIAALALAPASPAAAKDENGILRLATTTSLENSGLLDHLLPPFQQHCACQVQVIPVGTGRALQLGKRGDVDALLVHAPEAEKEFMAQGYGDLRAPIAYNYFILLSPPNDPADVASATDILDALGKIATSRAKFLSRGDDSGTHKKEASLWRLLRQSHPAKANLKLERDWYTEAGTGMGQAILMADELGAYLISDSGTYLHLQNRARLRPVPPLAKSALLYNPYSIIVISQTRHPHANATLAHKFAHWLQTPATRHRIANYRLFGAPLFTPHGE